MRVTPEWWDRDCRCCMGMPRTMLAVYQTRTGLRTYHMKGGVPYVTSHDEEIHADHTREEIQAWRDSLPAWAR